MAHERREGRDGTRAGIASQRAVPLPQIDEFLHPARDARAVGSDELQGDAPGWGRGVGVVAADENGEAGVGEGGEGLSEGFLVGSGGGEAEDAGELATKLFEEGTALELLSTGAEASGDGDNTLVKLINRIDQPTVIHWHG